MTAVYKQPPLDSVWMSVTISRGVLLAAQLSHAAAESGLRNRITTHAAAHAALFCVKRHAVAENDT